MNKVFLKSGEISLQNGNYLTSKDGNPVSNLEFEAAQRHAEFIVTFATLAKTKNFKSVKADSLNDLKLEVMNLLSDKATMYIAKPERASQPMTDKLKEEAMSFMNFQENSVKANKMNQFLQQFNVLNDFFEFGLYFNEGIVRLNKIYSMNEIVEAVSSCIDLLEG